MSKMAFYIKLIHSFLFFLIVASTIYVLITAAVDKINALTWWAFGVVLLELFALLLNNWRCPLTDLAESHGAEVGSVADLFLPHWLSERLFFVFGVLFLLTCLLLLCRLWG
ncbi:MAG: hypothetical protein U5J63_18105 [Fodinibius sp.]|nr:hypothetical protein [Fodinibius sp.]